MADERRMKRMRGVQKNCRATEKPGSLWFESLRDSMPIRTRGKILPGMHPTGPFAQPSFCPYQAKSLLSFFFFPHLPSLAVLRRKQFLVYGLQYYRSISASGSRNPQDSEHLGVCQSATYGKNLYERDPLFLENRIPKSSSHEKAPLFFSTSSSFGWRLRERSLLL